MGGAVSERHADGRGSEVRGMLMEVVLFITLRGHYYYSASWFVLVCRNETQSVRSDST